MCDTAGEELLDAPVSYPATMTIEVLWAGALCISSWPLLRLYCLHRQDTLSSMYSRWASPQSRIQNSEATVNYQTTPHVTQCVGSLFCCKVVLPICKVLGQLNTKHKVSLLHISSGGRMCVSCHNQLQDNKAQFTVNDCLTPCLVQRPSTGSNDPITAIPCCHPIMHASLLRGETPHMAKNTPARRNHQATSPPRAPRFRQKWKSGSAKWASVHSC